MELTYCLNYSGKCDNGVIAQVTCFPSYMMTHLSQSPLIEELLKCFFLVDYLKLHSGLDVG